MNNTIPDELDQLSKITCASCEVSFYFDNDEYEPDDFRVCPSCVMAYRNNDNDKSSSSTTSSYQIS